MGGCMRWVIVSAPIHIKSAGLFGTRMSRHASSPSPSMRWECYNNRTELMMEEVLFRLETASLPLLILSLLLQREGPQ